MSSLRVLSFSIFLLLLSFVVEGKEPKIFSYAKGINIIDVMIPNSEDITGNFIKSYPNSNQKLEYVFSEFSPTQILDDIDLLKVASEINRSGYVRKYCGIVMSTSIMKNRSSPKAPLVQLIMMTDHFSQIKVTIPFRSSNNMKMDRETLDYYTDKYSGKVICVDKIVVRSLIKGGINYILPHDFDLDEDPLQTDRRDTNYIQIF